MWPPLFNVSGSSPTINFAQSLGDQPVYSDNDKVVTLTIKPWKWSDGTPVTTRDLMFWINILKANKSQWAAYSPGQFPDNVTSMKVLSSTKLQMNLNKSYAPTFFTNDELSQITPIPQHVYGQDQRDRRGRKLTIKPPLAQSPCSVSLTRKARTSRPMPPTRSGRQWTAHSS